MTIPDPIKVLLAEAHRLVSDEAAPLAELKLLHANVTRLRNQFYDELDEANLDWENESGGDTDLQQVKREIDSQVAILADRIMSMTHRESVSVSLADRVPRGTDKGDELFQPLETLIPDLFLKLGAWLFHARRTDVQHAMSNEPSDCLLSWNTECASEVYASIRQLQLLTPISIPLGGVHFGSKGDTCFWVGLWAFSFLRDSIDPAQQLTIEDCERLLPHLSPDAILEWCNHDSLTKSGLTPASIVYLKSLVPRRVTRPMTTFTIGGIFADGRAPVVTEIIDTSFPWVLL